MSDPTSLMYIGGEWRPAGSGRTLNVDDPATGEPFYEVAYGGAQDCQAAIDAAASALADWSSRSPHARGRAIAALAGWFRDNTERLANLTTRESGKPLREAKGEWSVAADLFEYYAKLASTIEGRLAPSRVPGRELKVVPQPIGVVGVITAWNFPAYNPARAVAAALAAGCSVVLRPAELTPFSALAFGEAADATGLPAGALNIVCGDPAPIAQEMLSDTRCRKLSFTGSTRVGKELIAGSAPTVTSLSLELGGNAPVVICENYVREVGVDAFAKEAVPARFRNCGQVCIAPQRFYVQRGVYEELVAASAKVASGLRVGPGSDPGSDLGPMINEKQRDRVRDLVAESHGGRVVAGGGSAEVPGSGWYFAPTVVADVDRDSALWTEETFGPVLSLSPFDDLDGAIADANSLEAGLAAYAFAQDPKHRDRLAAELEFGMVAINGWSPHSTDTPFPGWKQSGLGAESGPEGLHEYQRLKVLSSYAS